MILQIAKVGVGVALFSPIAKGVGNAIEGIFEVASETISSAHKAICLGNNVIHRNAEMSDLKSQVKMQLARVDLTTIKRENLIKYGENTEALKARYQKLEPATQASIDMWEARFPEI